jgi:HlyD family secretion protein
LKDGVTALIERWKQLDRATAPVATAASGRIDHLGASTFIEKGWSKLSLDDAAGAELAFCRALELAPCGNEAETLLGWAQMLQQRSDEALATLSTDQINLSKASITAPSDGVVLTRAVDPGNAVAASLQAVTLFTVAEDLARVRLWVYVDEADVGVVKAGQTASFTVSAYPARSFPARITRVGFGSTITDNVVTYLTWLDVDNADLSLRPGMTATATIVATERKDVLRVPNAALRYTPTTAAADAKKGIASGVAFGPPKTESQRKGAADSASTAGARQVWVLATAPDGQALPDAVPRAVAVTPGISDGRSTEIVAGALSEGMLVITSQATGVPK